MTCLLTDSQASLTRSSLFVGTATLLSLRSIRPGFSPSRTRRQTCRSLLVATATLTQAESLRLPRFTVGDLPAHRLTRGASLRYSVRPPPLFVSVSISSNQSIKGSGPFSYPRNKKRKAARRGIESYDNKGLWLCSSNRDVCFVLLEMMLVGVNRDTDIYTSGEEKIANIYQYVKYNFCCLYRRGIASQAGNLGKAFLSFFRNYFSLSSRILFSLYAAAKISSPCSRKQSSIYLK